MMRIALVSNSLTHYYNRVLSKLNADPDIDLTVIVPDNESESVGAGVYQETDSIQFMVVRLREVLWLGKIPHLVGLADALLLAKPDIVIFVIEYSMLLAVDMRLRAAIRKLQCRVIIKAIPFRLESFENRLEAVRKGTRFRSSPNRFMRLTSAADPWRLIRRAKIYMDRSIYRAADAHINYIDAREMWASYGVAPERVFVTGNSPDTDYLSSISEQIGDIRSSPEFSPFRIIHVGRLVAWKRVDLLLQAFQLVTRRFPQAELLIVGEGPERERLQELAKSLHIERYVRFTGAVYDPMELGLLLKSCSVYVLAGMGGLSINDAMCLGLPVICSVCDGTEAVLVREGVNGRYFKNDDCDDLCEKICWFFEDADRSRTMGRNSLEIIRTQVNVNTVLAEYKNAFRHVMRHPLMRGGKPGAL